jgi:hypothetical protein
MKVCTIGDDINAVWEQWSNREYWEIRDAVTLMLGRLPSGPPKPKNSYSFLFDSDGFGKKECELLDMVEIAVCVQCLNVYVICDNDKEYRYVKPKEFIDWAVGKGYKWIPGGRIVR